jgi:hypothetical protein
MKKAVLFALLAALTGAVQADLVDGSFDGAGFFRESGTGKMSTNDVNQGWVDHFLTPLYAFDWASGYVERDSANSAGSRGFGQIFTMAVTGIQNVDVTWSQDETATGNKVRFDVYGFNSLSDCTNISVSGWTAGTLGGVVRLGTFSFNGGDQVETTTSISSDFGTGYAYLAFVSIVDNDTGVLAPPGNMRVSNVSVVPSGIVQFLLTVNANPGGTVTGTGYYQSNSNPQIKATASNGFAFVNWTGDVTSVNSTTNVLMTTNKTVWANFVTAAVYTLTVNSGTGDGAYSGGFQVMITADPPAGGKTFDRWTGGTQYVDNVFASTATLTMPTQAVTVTATYKDTQVYFYDGFDYPADTRLDAGNTGSNWTGAGLAYFPTNRTGTLTYPGLPSGSGGKVQLPGQRTRTANTAGNGTRTVWSGTEGGLNNTNLFASFLLNVDSIGTIMGAYTNETETGGSTNANPGFVFSIRNGIRGLILVSNNVNDSANFNIGIANTTTGSNRTFPIF